MAHQQDHNAVLTIFPEPVSINGERRRCGPIPLTVDLLRGTLVCESSRKTSALLPLQEG